MEVVEDLLIDNLKIVQDDKLYRFTSDSIILSRFASSRKNDVVADFCSGSGIVGIHFYALHRNVRSIDLVEIQKSLADLSEKSVSINKLEGIVTVYNKALQELDSTFNSKYSLIMCNPPYKKRDSGEKNPEDHIAICRHEVKITLEEIIEIASKKLQFGGRFCICQRIERFIDIINLMEKYKLNPNRIQFVSNKESGEPYLVLVEGTKGLSPQLKVLPTIINKD